MSKAWQAYARHVLDTIEKIRRIQQRGDLTQDEMLYDATLRNEQSGSEPLRSPVRGSDPVMEKSNLTPVFGFDESSDRDAIAPIKVSQDNATEPSNE
ncbi:hypothetical protein [Metallibacterium scheffleri]|uniref:Uncharacterized protein n=1 Tax=Metallibacterium scheffleri TaxID=993689 RepID=A0A4V3UT94_9GAMM|nr:hypothetical protein [Metallibacterium scheffleri]THD09821.1 hypothetical protein B1806_10010 [Metallibacterium scheffleri]